MQVAYIVISIAVFIVILVLLIVNRQTSHGISSLTMIGMTMVVLGIIFGDSRLVGYSLIGVGVLLSLIDAKYIKSHE